MFDLADLDESVGVIHESAAALEVPHDADGVLLGQQTGLVHLEDGQREAEQHLGALNQEAVPDAQQGLSHNNTTQLLKSVMQIFK